MATTDRSADIAIARTAGTRAPAGAVRSSGHQDSLDGLRVIAALAVLVTHVAGETGFAFNGTPASWVANRGDIGVPIFFALSGLLLFRPWVRAVLSDQPGPDVRAYLIRRALRILPAYWVVVVVAMIFLDQGGHARSPVAWAQYLLLVQVYDPHPWWAGSGAMGLAQMWSLAVEVSFYAVLPVLALVIGWHARRGNGDIAVRARRMLAWIAALAGISYAFVVLTYYPTTAGLWLDSTLPRYLTWFAVGMAVAVLAEWARLEPGDNGPVRSATAAIASAGLACWMIAGLTFILACTPLAGPEAIGVPSLWQFEVKTALYTVVAAAIVAPAAFQPAGQTPMNLVLGNPVMRFLGRISYGVFLWQYLAIFGLIALFGVKDAFHGGSYTTLGTLVALILVTLVSILAATASYYIVERPAQRLYGSHRARPASQAGRRPRRLIGRIRLGHDQARDQPADHDQAQHLRGGVPQRAHGATAVAGVTQVHAEGLGGGRGQQQDHHEPWGAHEPTWPGLAGEGQHGEEDEAGGGQDKQAGEPAKPEPGEQDDGQADQVSRRATQA